MPNVNPRVLVWARESAGLGLDIAARKLGFKDSARMSATDKLRKFECGERSPTRSLLVKMTKQYRRPLLTFYLGEPPRQGDRGEDYRTLTSDVEPMESAFVDALVRDVRARQEIVKDALLSAEDRDPLDFVASCEIQRGADSLAQKIQNYIEFDSERYRASADQAGAFKYLRECVESSGVFTLLAGNLGSHHTNIGVEVFRGFALSDEIAPFIVINDQDSKAAWSVTLLHELTHLWLGQTGVSGRSIELKTERFCNEVASSILLPEVELVARFKLAELANRESAVIEIDAVAKEFRVSSRLIAFRLLQQKSIDNDTYNQLSTFFQRRFETGRISSREKRDKGDGGPSYYVVKRHRLGTALLSASERLMRSGELSTTRTATVLGVRALNVEKLFKLASVA